MTAERVREENSLTLKLAGRLDALSAPELDEILARETEDVTQLTLDLKELDYLSSAGLRLLLKAKKQFREPEAFRLTGVNEIVREILDVTGFSAFLGLGAEARQGEESC